MFRAMRAAGSMLGVGAEKAGVMARSETRRVVGKCMVDGKLGRVKKGFKMRFDLTETSNVYGGLYTQPGSARWPR
jgi:hypothetical protein